MSKVRVGVIGSGYWGPNLIRNFVEMQNAEMVAVADLREDRLAHIKNLYHEVQITQDYQDLFKMELDAVVVATPPLTHFPFARDCLEHGLHVMVEKPLTLCSQDAQALIDLAEQGDRVLMVGHTFEYNSAVRKLKELIDSGEIGQVYYADAVRLNLGLFQRDLNAMWDLAPHDLSILLYLLGCKPVSVSAQGMSCVVRNGSGIQDIVYMNLVFPDNVLAHVHVSWLDPCKVRRVTVVGSKKMVVYNDLNPSEKIKIYDKGVDTPEYTDTYQDFVFSYRYGDVLIPNVRFTEPLREECNHFLDCIVNHKKPLSCGEEGLKVVRILETAQISLNNSGSQEMIPW